MPAASVDFGGLLRHLDAHGVRFVVVGGVAGILLGASLATYDLDVVYDTAADNLANLDRALKAIGAHYRDPAGRMIEPTEERLASHQFNLLSTRLGSLDLLQCVSGSRRYADLVERSAIFEIGEIQIRVIDLETLIESKAFANRPKDQWALLQLRRLQELGGGGDPRS